MKIFVLLLPTLTTALAQPSTVTATASAFTDWSHSLSNRNSFSAPSLSAQTLSQYHAQDNLGQASFGYAHPGQAHAVFQDPQGNVKGSYAYVDPEGKQVQVHYVADKNGFRVVSNDNALLKPVENTPEVKQATAAHFAAVAAAQARSSVAESNPHEAAQQFNPLELEDTPEVKAAKEAHFKALAAARALSSAKGFESTAQQPVPEHFPAAQDPAPLQFQAIRNFGEKFSRKHQAQFQDFTPQWNQNANFITDGSPQAFPVEIDDTPDVKAAKAAHFAAVAAAKARNLAVKSENDLAPSAPFEAAFDFGAKWTGRANNIPQTTFQPTQDFAVRSFEAARSFDRNTVDTNFNEQVQDTPEVKAAKAAHFAAVAAARARASEVQTAEHKIASKWLEAAPAQAHSFPAETAAARFRPIAADLNAQLQPVDDTPEVKAAKAEHFAAVAAAQARSLAFARSKSFRE